MSVNVVVVGTSPVVGFELPGPPEAPELLLPPPHATASTTTALAATVSRSLRFAHTPGKSARVSIPKAAAAQPGPHPSLLPHGSDAARRLILAFVTFGELVPAPFTVNVKVAVVGWPPLSVTELGAKAQVAPSKLIGALQLS